MTALALVLAALVVAAAAGIRAHVYHRDRRDQAWADQAVAYFARITRMSDDPAIAAMRSVAGWPTTTADIADHADEAMYMVADDLERRRLDAAVERHPAGRQR